MNVQNDVNGALNVLRQSYLDKLLDRMIILENAAMRLNEMPDDQDAFAALKRECHKLSGISHSLGFCGIGELATKIDCAIAVEKAGWSELEAMVDSLLDAIDTELD